MKALVFLSHVKKNKWPLIGCSAFLLAQAFLSVALPVPVKILIDRVLSGNSSTDGFLNKWLGSDLTLWLLITVGALFVMATISMLFDYWEETLTARVAQNIVEGIRHDLLEQILTRKQSYIDKKRKIDLLGRISGDTANLEILVTSGLSTAVRALPTLLLIAAAMMFIDLRFSLLLLIFLPLMLWLTTRFSSGVRRTSKSFRSELGALEEDAHQVLTALPLVKSLNMEDISLQQLQTRSRLITQHVLSSRRHQGMLTGSLNGARNFLRVLVLGIGGYSVINGQLSIGSLTLFLAYIEAINKPINELSKFASKYSKAMVSIERIEELFVDLHGQQETEGSQSFTSLPFPDARDLVFENVSFSYDDYKSVLKNFSMTIKPGELIAIVGPSGVGKTTFVKLLNRLHDPNDGRILLGRTDLKKFKLKLLRQYVTYISQEPYFIHGSIRQNLALANSSHPLIEDTQIAHALQKANCYEFVQSLPHKFSTLIGEGGLPLSGGQQKRLNLARAFLRENSHIYVFDEPTSGLDPETAQSVNQALLELAQSGAIVFLVTHRQEDVQLADQILFFAPNANPTLDTHSALIRTQPTYRHYMLPIHTGKGADL